MFERLMLLPKEIICIKFTHLPYYGGVGWVEANNAVDFHVVHFLTPTRDVPSPKEAKAMSVFHTKL